LPSGVQAVWDGDKAFRETTNTRERICVNGLWRWQPAGVEPGKLPAGNWDYFKVPGCWPGITDYMQKENSAMHRTTLVVSAICVIFATCATLASEPLVVDVWLGKAPQDAGIDGEETVRIYESPILGGPTKLITNVTKPTLTIYRPADDKNTGTAMLICPGGGYHNLFWELEGEEVAAGREQAVAAIRKLGGEVIVDLTKPGSPVVVVLTSSGKPADCLLHLKDLGNLHTCDL
jgi:hypothetical protein